MKTETKNTPTLRFPEFDGDWESRNLDYFLTFKNGINAEKSQYGSGKKFINVLDIINNNVITHEKIIGRVDVPDKEFEENEVNYGDILFQRSSETREEVGQSNVYVDREKSATFGGFVIRGKAIREYDPLFFNYLLKTSSLRKEITSKSGGSTRYNVSQSILEKVKVEIPSIPEQEKIASFLTSIDKKLEQLTKKKDLLEKYKKGVMKKIFNQEIRFKDENGEYFTDWEKVKLKKIISKFVVPMRDKPTDLTGSIPWCRIEDFKGKYLYESKSNQGVSKDTIHKMNLKVFPVNTLLVSCSANLGFCAITKKELITNQTFIGLVPIEDKVNVEFLFYLMKLSSRKLNRLASGTTISYLSREEFEKFKISLPCLKEQTKIANFLSAIDDKINLVNQDLEKTEIYKNGLFQQMFV